MTMRGSELEERLRDLARRQGFLGIAITPAAVDEEARRITLERVAAGFFDGLPWFDRARVVRASDPVQSLPGARSVVVLAASYAHPAPAPPDGRPRGRVARYAWGRDYHRVLEKRARPLVALLNEAVPDSRSRLMVDHGPLLERAYARAGGIGWQGKNTMLLTRGVGSYTFLAAILTTVPLEPDPPVREGCGSCARCLPSCPTGALRSEWELVNDLCIAHQTIENRGPIPRTLRPLLGGWVFGCDLCQEACPVNSAMPSASLPEFAPSDAEAAFPDLVSLLALDEERFRERFARRPILRAKRAGLVRNACVALGNVGDRTALPALFAALGDEEPLVRGHAAWAIARIAARETEPDEAVARLAARRDVESDGFVIEELDVALRALDATGQPESAHG